MSITRISIAVLCSAVLCGSSSRPAIAQTRGELVSGVERLHHAQMTFAKKYADDDVFAKKFSELATRGDFSGAAALAAVVMGLTREQVTVADDHQSGSGFDDAEPQTRLVAWRPGASGQSPPDVRNNMVVKLMICADLYVVSGCYTLYTW